MLAELDLNLTRLRISAYPDDAPPQIAFAARRPARKGRAFLFLARLFGPRRGMGDLAVDCVGAQGRWIRLRAGYIAAGTAGLGARRASPLESLTNQR